MRQFWQRHGLATVAALVLVVVALLGVRTMTALQFDQLAARGQNTLGLAVTALRGQLARYENLPALIAEHENIRALVMTPDDPALIAAVNQDLEAINTLLGSSDIYVMLPDGTTAAASNHAGPVSFVGENFAYRPYFQNALSGGQGRFFALGTTSLKRGYYFGAPIRAEGMIRGVVVFKVDLDAIEETWQGSDYEILVLDPEGIVFLSGRQDWLFTALEPLTRERLARTSATRRYADAQLRVLPATQEIGARGHRLLTIATDEGRREYLTVSEAMPEADWTVQVVLKTATARSQALLSVTAGLLLLGIGIMAWLGYKQRRRRLEERLQVQREAQEMLERRVSERTADLATVNRQLENEVVERRATERQLRKTQSDLVQAGKLAALGQMSAALSHEFNQPLGAVRAYAENAQVLIERGRVAEAGETIGHITGLVDRMATLSRHLRNFARKPNQKLRPVSLAEVLRDTQTIIDWRLRAADVTLELDLGPTPLMVRAGSVRLQQVLVNILSNAADAVEGLPERKISITARRIGEGVQIRLRDSGTGIAPGIAGRIFDPFFTTKGIGKGLGLGLSISYNIIKDFGGSLSVTNPPGGGAEFVIELVATEAPSEAAA